MCVRCKESCDMTVVIRKVAVASHVTQPHFTRASYIFIGKMQSWRTNKKKLFSGFYILNVLFGPKHAVHVWHSFSSFAAERNARGHGRAGEWCKQMTILSGAEQIRPKRYQQYTDSASTHIIHSTQHRHSYYCIGVCTLLSAQQKGRAYQRAQDTV